MRGRPLTLLSIALLAAPAASADPTQVERTFLERTAIAAADASCNLFSEGERLALRSGLYQAEGELLRADYTPAKLASLGAEVRLHAKSLGCDHPAVLEVAATDEGRADLTLKMLQPIETVIKALQAVDSANVVIGVIDAHDAVTEQDASLFGMVAAITLGLFVGTYSSVYMAAPILIWLKVDSNSFVPQETPTDRQERVARGEV